MNYKKILLFTLVISVIGIIPRLIKNSFINLSFLFFYFVYVGITFFLFFAINKFLLQAVRLEISYWFKFIIGLIVGYGMLLLIHLIVFGLNPPTIICVLNLKTESFINIVAATGFRAFIIQAIVFCYLLYMKNREEKIELRNEIEKLNQRLQQLRINQNWNKKYKETILTRFQDKLIPIEISKIAFFHLSTGIVDQYLFSEERYIQNITLESLENDLDPKIFFRANRQFLINKNAIVKVEQIENRKLKVILSQSLPEDIIISKAKSTTFIKWLEQQ